MFGIITVDLHVGSYLRMTPEKDTVKREKYKKDK